MPAVLARSHGKGKVAYLPAGLDAAYYLYAYPYQRVLLRNVIEWAATSPPLVRIEAPMCVHSTVMRQSRGGTEKLIIHLFNDVNTTAHRALPADDVPLREETIPIPGIRVLLDASYPVGTIRQEPEGIDLGPQRRREGGWEITVPRLDAHTMVVVELQR